MPRRRVRNFSNCAKKKEQHHGPGLPVMVLWKSKERIPREGESYSPTAYDIFNWPALASDTAATDDADAADKPEDST